MSEFYPAKIIKERISVYSAHLNKQLQTDIYTPEGLNAHDKAHLLLINDGQNMDEVNITGILGKLFASGRLKPLIVAAIHTDADRKKDYGIAYIPSYAGLGNKAAAYNQFIIEELLPLILQKNTGIVSNELGFAGFSLGGLSALDIVWNNRNRFKFAGAFSASLWWRSVNSDQPDYDDDKHRIMIQVIRNSIYYAGTRFFFQCGNMDETADRNNNGIIDSIDDTLDTIKALKDKGYTHPYDIYYYEMPEGRHDMYTWSQAIPVFLNLYYKRE